MSDSKAPAAPATDPKAPAAPATDPKAGDAPATDPKAGDAPATDPKAGDAPATTEEGGEKLHLRCAPPVRFLLHPYVPNLSFNNNPTPVNEIDSWMQAQIDAKKLEKC